MQHDASRAWDVLVWLPIMRRVHTANCKTNTSGVNQEPSQLVFSWKLSQTHQPTLTRNTCLMLHICEILFVA